jgi:hypothetical protein
LHRRSPRLIRRQEAGTGREGRPRHQLWNISAVRWAMPYAGLIRKVIFPNQSDWIGFANFFISRGGA